MTQKVVENKGSAYVIFFQKAHNPSLIMRETSDKLQQRSILQYSWPVLPQTVNVISNKEKSEKLL